jgi:hypothetical protein
MRIFLQCNIFSLRGRGSSDHEDEPLEVRGVQPICAPAWRPSPTSARDPTGRQSMSVVLITNLCSCQANAPLAITKYSLNPYVSVDWGLVATSARAAIANAALRTHLWWSQANGRSKEAARTAVRGEFRSEDVSGTLPVSLRPSRALQSPSPSSPGSTVRERRQKVDCLVCAVGKAIRAGVRTMRREKRRLLA